MSGDSTYGNIPPNATISPFQMSGAAIFWQTGSGTYLHVGASGGWYSGTGGGVQMISGAIYTANTPASESTWNV